MEQMYGAGVYLEGNGVAFSISNNFLGVTTPIQLGGSAEFKSGVFTNNAFGNLDYVTFMPTIGSGTTSDTPMNFFGRAVDGAGTGKIGWRSNNLNNPDPEVEIVGVHEGTINQRGGRLLIRTADPATSVLSDQLWVDEFGNFYPARDNVQNLGGASNRWAVVYAGTGTINTSDANEKTDFEEISDAEKRVAVKIKSLFKRYRFKDAVAKKGDSARYHFGAVAQEVAQAFENEGLVAEQYGIFCSDTWYEYNEKVVHVDADKKYVVIHHEFDGKKVDPDLKGKFPEGTIEVVQKFDTVERTRLGLRYDEMFAFVIASL
jgi:hypothetical protein